MTQNGHHSISDRGYAAVFIDFENVYYELKHIAPDRDVTDYILTVVRQLNAKLDQAASSSPIIRKAYADFERLDASPQGSLYLMGVETHNVMSTEHKNSADMRLCIDALDVLYTRPEIQTFVLVAGDRDYIPLVQHLRRQGRNVFVSSFRSNVSGDLLQNIEKGNFLDAFELLSEEERREIEVSRQRAEALQPAGVRPTRRLPWQTIPTMPDAPMQPPPLNGASVAPPAPLKLITRPATNGEAKVSNGAPSIATAAPMVAAPTVAAGLPETETTEYVTPGKEKFATVQPVTDEMTKRALEVMLNNFGQHHEIWLSPLLWKLSNAMPLLADFERKVLIANLESAGAIRVVKRQGNPHDYSAVVINYNHPTVRERMP